MLDESQIYTFPCKATKAPLESTWFQRRHPGSLVAEFAVVECRPARKRIRRARRRWSRRAGVACTQRHSANSGALHPTRSAFPLCPRTGLALLHRPDRRGRRCSRRGRLRHLLAPRRIPDRGACNCGVARVVACKAMGPGKGEGSKEHIKIRPSLFMVVMWVVVRPLARSAIGSTEYCGRSSGRRRASATMCCSGRGAATRR